MNNSIWRSSTVAVLAVGILNLGFAPPAHAGIVGTSALVQGSRDAGMTVIRTQLDRSDVRAHMLKLGVSAEAIDQRIATLSDREIQELAQRMDNDPAGGNVLLLVGAVFVVLMILEFTGVIDIFKRSPGR